MATIEQIGAKWRVRIRRKGVKPITKTFAKKGEAERWARDQESKIDRGETTPTKPTVTVADTVAKFLELREAAGRPVLDTANEHYVLQRLRDMLGDRCVADLSVEDLVDFAQKRRNQGANPYTVNIDVSKIGTVLRHTAHALKFPLVDVVGAARPTLSYLRLIGGGSKRFRRPTEDELRAIIAYAKTRRGAAWECMEDVLTVLVIVGFRRGEVCRLRWEDLVDDQRAVWVRDRKDPREKEGNDQLVPLLGKTWDVVLRQPRRGERIFPIHPQALSKYFTEACRALNIPDLHLHDLRHEASSALDEAGWSAFQIRAVTGHGVAKENRQLGTYVNPDVRFLHQLPLPDSKL